MDKHKKLARKRLRQLRMEKIKDFVRANRKERLALSYQKKQGFISAEQAKRLKTLNKRRLAKNIAGTAAIVSATTLAAPVVAATAIGQAAIVKTAAIVGAKSATGAGVAGAAAGAGGKWAATWGAGLTPAALAARKKAKEDRDRKAQEYAREMKLSKRK